MNEEICIGGDGGPLVMLQAAAVPKWQGARGFETSLMNGGDVETDYDVICDHQDGKEIFVAARYNRDLLVLWDSEFGASLLPSHPLSLSSDTLILTLCHHPDDLPDILPVIVKCIQQGKPQYSLLFNVQDGALRLQVGADSPEPSYDYSYLDIPAAPGMRRCDVYLVEYDGLQEEAVVITPHVSG